MIKIGDVIIRNIQEQVAKNKADIAALRNVESILNQFGITVLGRVDAEAEIPETKPGGGDYTYGDAWLVGTTTPYDMYIWTRTDDPDIGEFVNIGPISTVGPEGPQGARGPAGTIEIGIVSTGIPGSNASVVNVGTPENAILNFTIPQGAKGDTGSQGERGLTGETGPAGPTGPQGPQGDPGQSFMIVGIITNTSQLPDPTTTQRNYAYIYNDGDASTPDRLYYIIGDPGEETWTYSSLAQVGTTVYVNGNPVSTFDADTKANASDLSDYVDKTSTQIITGQKRFNNNIQTNGIVSQNGIYGLIEFNALYQRIELGNSNCELNVQSSLRPSADNLRSLGRAGYRWKDAYIAGNLTDGTNSISVANIVAKPTLLWSNPNPTAPTFTAQNLNIDTSAYSCLIFEFKRANDSESYHTYKVQNRVGSFVEAEFIASGRYIYNRYVKINSSSQIAIDVGYFGDVVSQLAQQDNSTCIPTAIYGTNSL